MTLKCQYRSLLPVGHTLLDLALTAFWIWHAVNVLNPQHRVASTPGGTSLLAAYASSESIGWDPAVYSTPDPHFALMLTGTLPAGIVSISLQPEAGWQTLHRLWDPIWLLIHEAIAIPFWFLLGAWLDTGRSRLLRPMRDYLLLRVVLAGLAIAIPGHSWWIPQFLFWMAIGVYTLMQILHRILGHHRPPSRVNL